MHTKALKRTAKIFIFIFIFIAFYVGLLNYQLYAANKEAECSCELAVIGKNYKAYKNDVYNKIDKKAKFVDNGWRHTFLSYAPLAFGAAMCEIKTDGTVIISKEFIPTAGG